MEFLSSIFIFIISFMPISIFLFVFKLVIDLAIKRRKRADFHDSNYEEKSIGRDLKEAILNSEEFKDLKSDKNHKSNVNHKINFEDISNKLKDAKKRQEINQLNEKKFQEKSQKIYKELRNNGYSRNDAFKILKGLKESSNGNVDEFEKNFMKNYSKSEKIKNDLEVKEDLKTNDKIVDSEFIRECESDNISYEDDSIGNDLLSFDTEDYIRFQIYKEIFDKPLSMR